MLESPPLSLYIHIPWCIRKCPYCDFNSHEAAVSLPEKDYVTALCEDFDTELENLDGRKIQSIFIGGGTPSLFRAEHIANCLDHIRTQSSLATDVEITLEANPGAVDESNFTGFRAAGINRLSLGIQSFQQDALAKLGRVHNDADAHRAIAVARNAGFTNINLDLMHGLPDQTVDSALSDLRTAITYEPEHMSWYELTIEPNTVFYRRPPQLPDDDILVQQQDAGHALLAESGYRRYEVSAYAKENRQSIHNINYWEFGDYIGIGAGAHGKLTNTNDGHIVRTRKHRQPQHYMASSMSRLAEKSVIPEQDRALEFLLNALRLREGFDINCFSRRTGLPFDTIAKQVECMVNEGLLLHEGERLKASNKGYLHLNKLLEEFL